MGNLTSGRLGFLTLEPRTSDASLSPECWEDPKDKTLECGPQTNGALIKSHDLSHHHSNTGSDGEGGSQNGDF